MLRALIIEDEADKAKSLRLMLGQVCPGQVEVVGEAGSVDEAVAMIREIAPDLLFLDVEIRMGTGFDVLARLEQIDFAIIFTTAYSEFAVDAFRFDAVDYLVKPIRSSLLREAVQRAQARKQEGGGIAQALESVMARMDPRRIPLATEEGVKLVQLSDILRCEGDGNYTTYYLIDGSSVLTSRNLGKAEEKLAAEGFLKVHQSHLVNTRHVESFLRKDGGTILMSNGDEVPVSRRLKANVQQWLDGL